MMHLNGVPTVVTAAWLGHADPGITLRTFAHANHKEADVSDPGHRGSTSETRKTTCRQVVLTVARAGIEPATFRFSGGRSYQLSYLAGRPRPFGRTTSP